MNESFPQAQIKVSSSHDVIERGQVAVCVFQYSPDRPAIRRHVRMEVIAMNVMEATPANANMATGGNTVK